MVLVGLWGTSLAGQRIIIPQHLSSVHPRIATRPDGTAEEMRARIAADPQSRKAVSDAEAELAPYLAHASTDSMWLASRLQMYWKSHATTIYNRGDVFDHAGGEAAPVPTVRYPGSRDPVTAYRAPRLEDIPPYEDDTKGVWLVNASEPGAPMEWAPPAKAGRLVDEINEHILRLTLSAARLYWITGDERYAELAFPVLDTYLRGIEYRSMPIDLSHGHSQTLYGISTFEVIQERVLPMSAEIYDLLFHYIQRRNPAALPVYADAMKRWADVTIANGVPFNNWDLFQARIVGAVALVLDDDSVYKDHRGAQYYLDQILNESSTRQWSLGKLAARGFDPATGIWFESPSYSMNVVSDFMTLINDLDEAVGTDLLTDLPVVGKAVRAAGQYLYPNGITVAFGDSHYGPLSPAGSLEMVRNAQVHHRREQEVFFTGMAKLLQNLAPSTAQAASNRGGLDVLFARPELKLDASIPALPLSSLVTPTFSAPSVSWFVQRSGANPAAALMIGEAGSLGNHMHANGIQMEFYGDGLPLAPESGIGTNYFQADHSEYYAQFPAHNTVVVDGISSYPTMKSHHGFRVRDAYPSPGSSSPGDFDRATFSEVDFTEPETDADQRRLLSIIRTGAKTGYYVDIFRSHRRDGHDLKNDYFFHGLGQILSVTDGAGHPLAQKPTNELTFADEELGAYDYLWAKRSVANAESYAATFDLKIPGRADAVLHAWMLGGEDRQMFAVNAPPSYALRDLVPKAIADLPLPTLVVRQRGEAWTRPFVSVFEPSSAAEQDAITSVVAVKADGDEPGFAGLRVLERDGEAQTILSEADGSREVHAGGIAFRGSYGVLSQSASERWMFLAAGQELFDRGTGLLCHGDHASAAFLRKGNAWTIVATEPCSLLLPATSVSNQREVQLRVQNGASISIHGERTTFGGYDVISFPIPATPLAGITMAGAAQ